jgi:GTP-binding protein
MSKESNKVPKIVLVGPTNVGKSTLFNRLSRTRAAIVADRPGVTVDRHEMRLNDSPLGVIDLIDTGGVGPQALEHKLGAEIERAAGIAVASADVILFVVDGTREAGVEEFEVARWLRRQKNIDGKPVWVVCNKRDSKDFDDSSYYSLGFDHLLGLSAEHGEGILDLWDALHAYLQPDPNQAPVEKSTAPRVMVIGRPNVGKSTLLNAIIGEERHVVSEMPGTTRDVIETEYQRHGITWRLADTAGMRRPGRLERSIEWVAREKLKDAARGADVAVVVIDSSEGVTDLDAAIAGMAVDFGLSLVLAFNKTDKLRGDETGDMSAKLERTQDLKLDFLEWAPQLPISALTGKGVGELIKRIEKVLEARQARVQTSRLNTVFESKLRLHHHPIGPRGKPAKFYYLSQVSVNPPEFVLFSNLPGNAVHFSFRRFVTNTLRKEFGFEGTPIRLHFKTA